MSEGLISLLAKIGVNIVYSYLEPKAGTGRDTLIGVYSSVGSLIPWIEMRLLLQVFKD